jgi:uncharacterized protein (DUF2267 family)
MDTAELYAQVEARLPDGVEVDGATAVHALLTALAERLTPDEAVELGAELPEELGDVLAAAHGTGQLERDELLENLAARLDLDDEDAEAAATAVLTVIREALEPMVAIEQVLESLPPDLAQLMS